MSKGRRSSGGRAARREARTSQQIEFSKYIERKIPNFEILNAEALELIELSAEDILEEIGIKFPDNEFALNLWKEAGADVKEDLVKIPKGLARQLCSTAPNSFIQHARSQTKSVEIGGRSLVCAPVYGPPFIRDLEGGRRYAEIADFEKLVKLAYMSKWVHHSGGTVCEPTDIPVNKRHLDMLFAHMTLSDKPYMGSVTAPERAEDSVEMSEIIFGKKFVSENTVMTSLININSPLVLDATMMGALEVYARANQACIISPFVVGGAMAPVTVAGTLSQVLAEVLAGVAYSQLVRSGAPVIFGTFVTSIDMNSGAPTFGTPESSKVLYGAGQLARRLGIPFRSGGGLCGSKITDAQAAYETSNSLHAGLMGGVNFMLHSCGWLEGGLVASVEKFIMDADQLGVLNSLSKGIEVDKETLAFDAIKDVGAGGHFLGCDHTQENFKSAFWRSDILNYKPFETWQEEGEKDLTFEASKRAKHLLKNYEPPYIDISKKDELSEFVLKKKGSMPDAFV